MGRLDGGRMSSLGRVETGSRPNSGGSRESGSGGLTSAATGGSGSEDPPVMGIGVQVSSFSPGGEPMDEGPEI